MPGAEIVGEASGMAIGMVGGATCQATGGLTCIAAALSVYSGADHVQTGMNNFGKPASQRGNTITVDMLRKAGLSEETANNIQFALDVFSAGKVAYAGKPVTNIGKEISNATDRVNVGKTAPNIDQSAIIKTSQQQLARKFKHAKHFGITDTKTNPGTLKQFDVAIKKHMSDLNTFEKGIYGPEKGSKVFFNPQTNNVVVIKSTSEFISGFKLTPGTPQYKHYMEKGFLR